MDLEPNFRLAHRFLGQVFEQNGRYETAIAELKRAAELSNNSPIDLGALGHVYGVSGRRQEAFRILQQLHQLATKRYVSGFHFALVSFGLGDKGAALEGLAKAFREHSGWMLHLKVDPRLDLLRSDPQFQDLLRRVGLPP